jgi:hypothetical protein
MCSNVLYIRKIGWIQIRMNHFLHCIVVFYKVWLFEMQ